MTAPIADISRPEPITGVIFDYHSTLVDQGEPDVWLAAAWRRAGHDGDVRTDLGDQYAPIAGFLDEIWSHGRALDPTHERDLGAEQHWAVFRKLAAVGDLPESLVRPLWESMLDVWRPYRETVEVLQTVRAAGVKVALLSNIGIPLDDAIQRDGLDHLLDATIQSWQVGAVKPDPRIFQAALDALGTEPQHTLMVGDTWSEDGAAAALGIRTLILPRTRGAEHGLTAVLGLLGLR